MNITRISAAVVIVLCAQVEAEDKKPAKDDAKWQSLFDGKTLTGWKSSYSAGSGKVEVKDGAIVLPKGEKMTGITYDKKDFPKTDYEVVLEGKRVDGGDFFCTTTFPIGDSFCSLVIGGWGGRVTGLSSINGSDASENETTGSMDFKNGEWYKVRIRVSAKKIEAGIGNEQVVDCIGMLRRICAFHFSCENARCSPIDFCALLFVFIIGLD